ncbi:cyclic nucleotide-binding domain-containing protein [candidate division KSB1 bacterium]|nr:cyclic nucleotide-binding domain-containing protein [candidate division KSB1 bacterium]
MDSDQMSVYDDLNNSMFARGLTKHDLELIVQIARGKRYYKDEIIFSENVPGDKIFILAEGKVLIERRVMPDPHLFPKLILTVKKGQIFGEMAFVEKNSRSATARTKSNVRVIYISSNDLMNLMSEHTDLACRIMTNLASILSKRLRRMNEQWLSAHAQSYILPDFEYH